MDIILAPFKAGLAELAEVAETSYQSIDDWSKQLSRLKEKNLDLVAGLVELKAARDSIFIQIAATVFTILLTILMFTFRSAEICI